MLPKHKLIVDSRKRNAEDYYVNEYNEIDARFPYPHLTLTQLGIPAQDILLVHTDKADYYVELNG